MTSCSGDSSADDRATHLHLVVDHQDPQRGRDRHVDPRLGDPRAGIRGAQRDRERRCRTPTVLVTEISPPIDCTIWCEIARPETDPDAVRLGREEWIEHAAEDVGGNADAGVLDLDEHPLAIGARA